MTDAHRVFWAPSAIDDLDEILDYVAAQDGAEAAVRLYDWIARRIESLALHPRRCRVVPELARFGIKAYRELIASPYRVFVRIREGRVNIVAIIDGRRDLEELLISRVMDDI